MANVIILPTLLTRPADTNIYAVGDGIAALTATAVMQELPAFAGAAGGTAFLVGMQVVTNMATCQGGIRVHFYNALGVSAAGIIEDNAVYTLLTADQALYQGFIDLPAFNTEDASSTVAVAFDKGLSVPLTSEAGTNKVYFQFELKTGAFTPTSAQTFRTTAWVVQ